MAKTDSPGPLPNLEPRFLQPEGWRWHQFKNLQGQSLRFGTVSPKNKIPDAVVVCLPGLSEFSEKYYELAHDLLNRNLSMWVMDWQGQGLSQHSFNNSQKRHSLGFENDVADLHYFIKEYVKHASVHPDVGRIPLVMLAHSMGANIGLRYLIEHRDIFSCAAFSAPLTHLKAAEFLPLSVAVDITSLLKEFMNLSYVFGGGDWKSSERDNPKTNIFSHDPVRAAVHNAWFQTDSRLQVGHITYGWLYEALRSCYTIQNALENNPPDIPCLFALAGKDNLVSNKQTKKIIKMLPETVELDLDEAFHEILMERDDIRNQFLDAFMNLLHSHNIKDKLKRF
jgi:lysophospholipase